MGMISRLVAKSKAAIPTNAELTRSVGLSLDTILTPKNKRKKTAGLRGADPEETIGKTLGG
jgi:hypothetical protein